jgi:hypothetical protein
MGYLNITVMNRFWILYALVFIVPAASQSQNPDTTREKAYNAYSMLVGGTWETKGQWQNGGEFHQEIVVETELTQNIFIVKTHDYIDSKQFEHARRNYGIRAWDEKEQKMKFWEFDVFGGITTGEVIIRGNDIYHVYQYRDRQGQLRTLADIWIYIDENSYTYKVCEFPDGKPGNVYLTSTFTRK